MTKSIKVEDIINIFISFDVFLNSGDCRLIINVMYKDYVEVGYFEEMTGIFDLSIVGDSFITPDGLSFTFSNGKLHNEIGPAIKSKDVAMYFYNGKLKSIDSNPTIKYLDHKLWLKDGLFHRVDGPAYINTMGITGDKYYLNGELYHDRKKWNREARKYRLKLYSV